MGKWILVGLLAFAVALVGTAYAEVQNVKVSGDLDMKAIAHHNYDLKIKQGNISHPQGPVNETGGTAPVITNDDDAGFYLSTTRVRVDADLTDNVSTSVRLLNQRFWDTDVDATNNIDIDNAYVVLKEFLYSPLTVIVGRQDLNYGSGFIVGAGLLGDPNGMFGGAGITIGAGGTMGQEYSAYNSYDAIRLILDFAPVTVEGLIAKISETGTADDDQNLYGLYVTYKADRWNAVVEPYWFLKSNEGAGQFTLSDSRAQNLTNDTVDYSLTHTVGLRTAASPIENLAASVEGAYQFGEVRNAAPYLERKRSAWAGNVDLRYTWANVTWTPATGAGWVYYSGESSVPEAIGGDGQPVNGLVGGTNLQSQDSRIVSTSTNARQSIDTYNAWDPMYRGSFTTFIQDFLGGNDAAGLYATFDANDTAASTNRMLIYGDLSLKPLQDLTFWTRYTHAWFANAPRSGRSKDAGDEVDMKVTYDYTEDVQLGLFGAAFFPGTYYDQRNKNTGGGDLAWTVGGSAAVKF